MAASAYPVVMALARADEATEEAEKQAFAQAWQFMQASRPRAICYYAPYEKTICRKLRGKYPDVCSADDCRATRVLRDALQNMA